MLAAAAALPGDCRNGYAAGRSLEEIPSGEGLAAIAFCGMGGSGVSGEIIRALYRERLRLPVEVVRGSVLPEFCGPHTLVLCCSYSGNTAETLACFDEGLRRGCRMVVVSSGGELARRAAERGVNVVFVPDVFPKPRAAFGFLTLGALGALESAGLIPPLSEELEEAAAGLEALGHSLEPGAGRADNPAKDLAVRMGGRVPVVWGGEGIGAAAAARWKAQFNENAKVPAFASSLPELDHNEIVGWSEGAGTGFFLLALRHGGETADVAARFPPSIGLAEESGLLAREVRGAGRTPLERLLSLVMIGDFTSIYLGLCRGFDPAPIEAIDRLKRALAES